MFLNSECDRLWINDSNESLIHLYKDMKYNLDELLAESTRLFQSPNNSRGSYDELKAEFNSSDSSVRRSATFLYLNRHGYRGLYRENESGDYNVPYGNYKHPRLLEMAIRKMSDKLQAARITNLDFRDVLKEAQAGDVLYCDPPYIAATFHYNRQSFSRNDHRELIHLLSKSKSGCVLNNSDGSELKNLAIDNGAACFSYDCDSRIESGTTSSEVILWW